MISDNQTNTVYFSSRLKTDARFTTFCNNLTNILQKHNISYKFLENTNDIWVRDFMPIQVTRDKFVEYVYDPDYLLDKKGRSSKSYPGLICDEINLKTTKTDLIIDGGNVIKYGGTVIMTDKVIPENSHKYRKAEVMSKLVDLFETERIILIPWVHDKEDPKKDYGHADGMVRLIDENKVLVDGCYWDESFEPEGRILLERLRKNKLEIIKLNFGKPYRKWHKNTWGYLNFLQMKDLLLIPVFGKEEDGEALSQFNQLFPNYLSNKQIETINANDIIKFDGVLNCISWNVLE